jgi:carbamoyltransferase
MHHVSLGTGYSDEEIERDLTIEGMPYRRLEREALLEEVARRVDEQQIIGWFQGRMEYGPRALGHRSIIADARKAGNRDRVNLAIKFREGFRPFAPSVPEDSVGEWFEWSGPSRFMLFVANTRQPEALPAITHLDRTARLQTVARETNPLYYDLHRAFERRTGCPVMINTSFNVRGEPIVRTPVDAIRCFLGTGLDALVLGPFLVDKKDVPSHKLLGDHRSEFAPD